MRDIIALACIDCKRRNYSTTKNRKKSSERLELSIKTVETYREHLKTRFGVQSAAMLAAIATEWVTHGGRKR